MGHAGGCRPCGAHIGLQRLPATRGARMTDARMPYAIYMAAARAARAGDGLIGIVLKVTLLTRLCVCGGGRSVPGDNVEGPEGGGRRAELVRGLPHLPEADHPRLPRPRRHHHRHGLPLP
eukprot:387932-Prorocentrum_minimum.AAC.1